MVQKLKCIKHRILDNRRLETSTGRKWQQENVHTVKSHGITSENVVRCKIDVEFHIEGIRETFTKIHIKRRNTRNIPRCLTYKTDFG